MPGLEDGGLSDEQIKEIKKQFAALINQYLDSE